MPSWITKEMRRQMTAIARQDEKRLESILSKTHGHGTDGLDELNDEECFILYCHFQNYPEIADHISTARSTASQHFNDRGMMVEDLKQMLMEAIDEIEDDEFELEGLEVVRQQERERLEAQIDYYRGRYEKTKAENDKLRNYYGLYRDIITDVVDSFDPVPASYPEPDIDYDVDEELCILPISDVHVGECVVPERMGGLTHYNWDTFLHRIEEYKRGVNSIVNEHQRRIQPVNTALVFLLGDITTGEDVFHKQLAHIDMPLVKQIFDGGLRLAELIRWLGSMFENVRVFSCWGNHGETRTTTLNTDYVLYSLMATALANQPNVDFHISESHYMGLRIDRHQDYLPFNGVEKEWNFLITHGHQAKSYMGLPFYSLERLVRRYSSMTGILWDKLFCGHHHQDVPGPQGAWAVNGSWVGGTEYSQEKMQGNSQPCQRIWGFHPNRGLTWSYSIDLDDASKLEMKPDDNGIYTPHTTVSAKEEGGFEFRLQGVEE